MRLKKIKGADEYIKESSYVVNEINFIENLHIEIGCGKGDFIINMALKYPNINFVGIEKYTSVLYKALLKIENKSIPNLKFMCIDANEIENYLSNKVDLIYLNFSDPWPKNRHYKRRLTSHDFLEKYEKLFKNDIVIYQKTDNRLLFEFSLESFSTKGYTLKNISCDLHNSDFDNIKTEYEEKFSKKGFVIYRVEAYKNK